MVVSVAQLEEVMRYDFSPLFAGVIVGTVLTWLGVPWWDILAGTVFGLVGVGVLSALVDHYEGR